MMFVIEGFNNINYLHKSTVHCLVYITTVLVSSNKTVNKFAVKGRQLKRLTNLNQSEQRIKLKLKHIL